MAGTKWLRGKKDQGSNAKRRREVALSGLQHQLKSGVKPPKPIDIIRTPQEEASPRTVPLTEKDVKRIKKEIAILEERV